MAQVDAVLQGPRVINGIMVAYSKYAYRVMYPRTSNIPRSDTGNSFKAFTMYTYVYIDQAYTDIIIHIYIIYYIYIHTYTRAIYNIYIYDIYHLGLFMP